MNLNNRTHSLQINIDEELKLFRNEKHAALRQSVNSLKKVRKSKQNVDLSEKRYHELLKSFFPSIRRKEGELYQQSRELFGLSLREVARLSGISKSTLHRFEKGIPVRNRNRIALRIFEAFMHGEDVKCFIRFTN